MGYLQNFDTLQEEYYEGNDHGNYQFTSLNQVIDQFIVGYVGEDKTISKVKRGDVAFHAQRALQELSFDTLKSTKAQEITLPPSLQMILPRDYVNYTKVSWVDSAGIKHLLYPASKTSNPTPILQNTNGTYYSNKISNSSFQSGMDGWDITNMSSDTDILTTTSSNGLLLTSNGLGTSGFGVITTLVNLEDNQKYKLSFNILSFDDNGVSPTKIQLKGSTSAGGDSSYKPVNASITATGIQSHEFTFDKSENSVNSMVVNIEVVDGDLAVKTMQITGFELVAINNDGSYQMVNNDNFVDQNDSTTWSNYKSGTSAENQDDYHDDTYWPMDGSRYGLDPQYAQANGSFYIDNQSGKIHFSSNISGKTVILDYISDSLGTDEEMQVHKFAEEAVYKCIAYAILSTRANVQEYVIQRYKKERFAAIRTAKLRLSNLKLEELTQILRGKSKQIKH